MEQLELKRYAGLLVRTAVNLKDGQPLYIEASTACEDFVCLIEQEAFAAGASDVTVRWISDAFESGRFMAPSCNFCTAEADYVRVEKLISQRAAYLRLESPDPARWRGVPDGQIQARLRAENPLRSAFRRDAGLQNVIACAATPQWARAVFPDLKEKDAVDQLWKAILSCTMADLSDPEGAWRKQIAQTNRRKEYMNQKQYSALRFKSATVDLETGLPAGQIWEGGGHTTSDGLFFLPNLPSFEVFTSPVADQVNGWIKATMPLNYQGRLIEGISLTFQNGRVVDYTAATGKELLGEILRYDKNSNRLGEVALVEQSTPVSRQGVVFYTTVCDENASCHLALGNGFASCGEEKAIADGINRSGIHVDFMFGSDDLCVWGREKEGNWVELFHNGAWTIEQA